MYLNKMLKGPLQFFRGIKEKLNLCINNSPPPPYPSSVELESNSSAQQTIVVAAGEAGENNNEANHGTAVEAEKTTTMWMKWTLMVVGVCVATISTALQALQTTAPVPEVISQLVYMALVIFLTAVMVSLYIRSKYKRESDVLLNVAMFFGAAALVAPLVSKLPFILMVTSIAIISSGIFVVIVGYLSKPTT